MATTERSDTPSSSNTLLIVPNLRDQALRTLRARIIAGEIEPARLYAIGQIAEELGVSITPIREALIHLSRDGLITMERNRGFRVRVMSEHDLDEIVELRRMIEVPSVRTIAADGRVTDDRALRELAQATERSAELGDWVGFLDHDRDFHLGLLAHLENQRLLQIVGSLRDQSRLYGLDHIAGTPQLMASTREHDQMLDAIMAGDAALAAQVMDQHLDHARGLWAAKPQP